MELRDNDQKRFVDCAEKYIINSLNWCGLHPDEGPGLGGCFGPYRQSERKEMDLPYAEQLVSNGFAYYAFDTSEELTKMRERMKKAGVSSPQYNAVTRSTILNSLVLSKTEVKKRIDSGEPFVIRIKMPRNEEVRLNDLVRGWVVVNTNNMDDKVIYKSDGMPTYHFANVVDDHMMKITHVIRGEEWLPSLPLHVLLYKSFGWDPPVFAHIPLILKPSGKGKLSKRDGEKFGHPVFPLEWRGGDEKHLGFKEFGILPEALINYMALLGWSKEDNKEIYSFP